MNNTEDNISMYNNWNKVEEKPEFDGEYLCVVHIKQECGNIWVRHKVRMFSYQNWVLKDNETVSHWTKCPSFPEMITHN